MEKIAADKTTLCPSARPESVDSVVFGVVGGTVTEPRVAYLKKPQPITDELIAKASPITPAEIFRTVFESEFFFSIGQTETPLTMGNLG